MPAKMAPSVITDKGALAQADPLIFALRTVGTRAFQGRFLTAGRRQRAGDERTFVATPLPLSYFQDLRVEHEQSLLHDSALDLDAIAAEVGYIDGATLRTLLRQRLGRGVRDLRADLR